MTDRKNNDIIDIQGKQNEKKKERKTMTKKEEMQVRENIALALQGMTIEGLDFEGETIEGLAFSYDDRTFIIKTICKKEDFDLVDALEEFEEREKARIEREEKKKAKLEKVEKEKAKKSNAKKEETETETE